MISDAALAGWKAMLDHLEFCRHMAAENRGITFDQSSNEHQDGRAAAAAYARDMLAARIKELEQGNDH